MNLQKSTRIIKEESKLPINILRRLDLSVGLFDKMKKAALIKSTDGPFNVHNVARYAAEEIIPWHDEDGNDYEDFGIWVYDLKDFLINKYGEQTKEYINKVYPQGVFKSDGYDYIFLKHSDINGGNGFSEGYNTWGDLVLGRGWWFPLDWWEIKAELDNMDEGKKLILKPNDKHNDMGYYFSIIKKKSNLREQQIKEGLPNRTKELILDKIRTMGFDDAASIVGGKDNLSKITGINTYEEYLNLFNDLTISTSQEKPYITLYKNDKGINVFVNYYEAKSDNNYIFINHNILQKPLSEYNIQKSRVFRKWLKNTYDIEIKNTDFLKAYYPGEENAGGYLEYLT
jgi:hypothetical protein